VNSVAVKGRGLFSPSVPAESAVSATPGWLISRGQDLIWFQGSVFAGVALLLLFKLFPGLNNVNYNALNPAVIILLLWGIFLDGTHVFGTFARTYFAPDEKSKAGLPSNAALLWLGLGPVIAVLDYFLCTPSASIVGQAGILFKGFLVFALVWAYYHLIRQHYGFVALYRRKEPVKDTGNLDTWFLWVGSLYPYLRFSLTPAFAESGLPVLVPASMIGTATLALDVAFGAIMVGLMVAGLWSRRSKPRPLGPKHLLIAIVVTFHILVFSFLSNLLVITAVLTIFHNLQYHRIIFMYEKGNKRVPMGGISKYIIFGSLFGLAWYGPRFMGTAIAGTAGLFLVTNILLGLGWGVAFHHYFVDARIWRVRSTPNVGNSLDRGAEA